MIASPGALLAGFGGAAGAFYAGTRLRYADEVVHHLRPGEFPYHLARVGLQNAGVALRMGDRALAGHWLRIGAGSAWRLAKPNLLALVSSWLVGNATSSLLRAENLRTIPLPGQVVASWPANTTTTIRQPIRRPNVYSQGNENADIIQLRVRLVPSY